jgi:Holliday junction resolvasome RuvABC endonuclease subunit
MRLLALDQASKVSGYAVFIDGKLETFGKLSFNNESLGERLFRIREAVAKLIADYGIEEVIFEDIQLQSNVGNNVQTFKALAEVYGVIYELVTELDLPNTSVLASSWKSALGIKGRTRQEQKRKAQAYVTNIYGIKATQDESDAICIGSYFLNKQDKVDTLIKESSKGFDWSD